MEPAGSGSWRFTEDVDEMAHVVQYVRDVLELDVAALSSGRERPSRSIKCDRCLVARS
jgi:hypothetical protein